MAGSTSNPTAVPALNVPFVTADGRVNIPWYRFLITLFNRTGGTAGNSSGSAIPSGMIQAWGGNSVPDGYLLCDGSLISRTSYPNLYSAIGITWGAGDGSSTFGIPDLRDKVILGAGGSQAAGAIGGSSNVTLTQGNLPSHNHPIIDSGHLHPLVDPGHNHTIIDPQHNHTTFAAAASVTTGTNTGGVTSGGTTGSSSTGITINPAYTGATVGKSTTGVTTGATGSGTPFNITPPFAAALYIIKT